MYAWSYLGGRMTDAKYGGDGHGGSAELDGGATPAETMEMQKQAWTCIYTLRRSYRTHYYC